MAKKSTTTKRSRTPNARERERREPKPFVLPERQWDRATELTKMFVATGWLENERPQSMMLISDPGNGKTELLERFTRNSQLQYASDMTVRGLHQVLKQAQVGATTHLVATEFQKFFMRKAATADNTIGTLCQALEEGVFEVLVGERAVNFGGAQLGLIAAITTDTMHEKARVLKELGFLSRVSVFPWSMTHEELFGVMSSIGRNDKSDLEPIILDVPPKKVFVDLPEPLSDQFKNYVYNTMREHAILRVFNRFRALSMACAVLDGRDVVHARDVEKVVSFQPYWRVMYK